MLQFEFPLNSKENLADELLRINRTQPVVIKLDDYLIKLSKGDWWRLQW